MFHENSPEELRVQEQIDVAYSKIFENNQKRAIDTAIDKTQGLTIGEVADILHVDSGTIDTLFTYGKIKGHLLPESSEKRIPARYLREFLEDLGYKIQNTPQNWMDLDDRAKEIGRIASLMQSRSANLSDEEKTILQKDERQLAEAHGALRHADRTAYVKRHGLPGFASIVYGDILTEWLGARERILKILEKSKDAETSK